MQSQRLMLKYIEVMLLKDLWPLPNGRCIFKFSVTLKCMSFQENVFLSNILCFSNLVDEHFKTVSVLWLHMLEYFLLTCPCWNHVTMIDFCLLIGLLHLYVNDTLLWHCQSWGQQETKVCCSPVDMTLPFIQWAHLLQVAHSTAVMLSLITDLSFQLSAGL